MIHMNINKFWIGLLALPLVFLSMVMGAATANVQTWTDYEGHHYHPCHNLHKKHHIGHMMPHHEMRHPNMYYPSGEY
jgi:hypothetical protein